MKPMRPVQLEELQSEERPEWLPPMVWRNRLNGWLWRSPGRVVVFLVSVPCLLAVLTVAVALSGGRLWWVFCALTVLNAAYAVVYAPRAWRAHRG